METSKEYYDKIISDYKSNGTRPLFRIVVWNRVNIFGQKQKDWLKMKEEAKVNYSFALKNYQQNGRGRSMKKFCEEEGYDYEKFMQYSRRGQKEYSVLKEADARQTSDKFIPLVVDGPAESVLGILDVRVRFTNGMELSQSEGDLNELFGMVRKMLG